jgi:hypothetical protein
VRRLFASAPEWHPHSLGLERRLLSPSGRQSSRKRDTEKRSVTRPAPLAQCALHIWMRERGRRRPGEENEHKKCVERWWKFSCSDTSYPLHCVELVERRGSTFSPPSCTRIKMKSILLKRFLSNMPLSLSDVLCFLSKKPGTPRYGQQTRGRNLAELNHSGP